MLRLQASEIAIAPDDIRRVNDRLDRRTRARGKVKLHRGPERSRDEAVISHDEGSYWAYTAEHFSEDDGSGNQSQSNKTQIRLGFVPPTSSSRLPGSGHSTAEVRLISVMASEPAMSALPILPYRFSSNIHSVQPQLDGQLDAPAYRLQPVRGPWRRHFTVTPQLLQSRVTSAPSFSLAEPCSPIRPLHSRQLQSESAIVLDNNESSNLGGPHRTSTDDNRTSNASTRYTYRSFATRASAGEMTVTTYPAIAAAIPINPKSETSDKSLRSSSSSSSAAEAAAADRPSPLDNITLQAALVHTRLASQTRQGSTHSDLPATIHQPYSLLSDQFERIPTHTNPEFSSYSRLHNEQLRQNQQLFTSTANPSEVYPSHSRTLSSSLSNTNLRNPHRGLLLHPEFIRRPVSSRLHDAPSRYAGFSSDRRDTVTDTRLRQPIPPRYSSRPQTPLALETTSMVLPRTRQANSISPSQTHSYTQAHTQIPSSQQARTIPRRNGAEIQRATALPLPVQISHLSMPPTSNVMQQVTRSTDRTRQRNQENSEEAAMSVFQNDFTALRLRDVDQHEGNEDSGVMDDTPPRSRKIERYLTDV